MTRTQRGAASAASLFTWVEEGGRRRLVSKRRVGTLKAPAPQPEVRSELTVQELRSRATELDISGRSSMTKDELATAIEAAEQEA